MSVWLCQIAKNIWFNEYRKNKKFKMESEENLFFLASDDETEATVITNENKMELYKKLQTLDDLTREVIYLRITGDLSFKEIGNILNRTENWARVTFYRGKQKLKEVD